MRAKLAYLRKLRIYSAGDASDIAPSGRSAWNAFRIELW